MEKLRRYLLALSLSSYSLKEQYAIWSSNRSLPSIKKWIQPEWLEQAVELNHQKTQYITIMDSSYPDYLKEIYLPPLVLYYEGDLQLLKRPGIGLVGSRQMTSYGQAVVKHLMVEAKNHQLKRPIVSGLAQGVDGYSHLQALKNHLKTIAVVGTGLNQTYPKHHQQLDQIIRRKGLVVSEYPPNTPPRKHHFPMRNRIIAGLCSDLIVIEAKERSGSLITANLALQENRNVFAVPGSIFNEQSVGTNQIIQAGAMPLLRWEDLVIQ